MPDTITDARHLPPSGEESGTAPGDRRFRPDVEGLRAVAVVLVVLFHAGVPGIRGGYVGVDVFFVISGFVITGVLLRERSGTGRTSIADFYARRVRRILPAATLVIVVATVGAYVAIGVVSGTATANDGRWAAVFLANFHFESIGTDYLSASRPPSPLQNYWSLSVEEQFYLVYPTLFLVVAAAKKWGSLRARLTVVLALVIAASFWLSVTQTAADPNSAYFSPFTRAWELALGGLVAVATPWLLRVPTRLAAACTWAGFAAVVVSAVVFTSRTPYPGALVAVPVVGAALIIAGGVCVPRVGAETVLGLGPFQWFGRRSYSLYLWHWPILIIAAERVGRTTLPVGENLVLMVVAVGASMVTYRLVENPIRHWRRPTRQTLAVGATLVLSTVVLLSLVIFGETAPAAHRYLVPAASEQVVLRQVAAATRTTVLPTDVQPSLADVATDWGGDYENLWCEALQKATTVVPCERGDPKGSKLLVVYGDSHAIMWLPAFEDLAVADHWRLVVLGKYYCPAEPVTIVNQATWADPTGPFVACDQWHQWAVNWINAHRPDLLVITQENSYTAPSVDGRPPRPFTTAQWHNGMTRLLGSLAVPSQDEVILGNTPASLQSGPVCLTAHTQDVQACSTPRHIAVSRLNRVDQATALGAGVRYVDPVPWFCAQTCPALIRGYIVYWDSNHITATWAKYLEILLGRAVGLPVPGRAK